MPLTFQQEIKEKPKAPQEPWSFNKLFPLKATVSSLTKSFSTPLDILLFFLILIIGISELIGGEVSWMLYTLTVFILVANVVERQKILPEKKKGKK